LSFTPGERLNVLMKIHGEKKPPKNNPEGTAIADQSEKVFAETDYHHS